MPDGLMGDPDGLRELASSLSDLAEDTANAASAIRDVPEPTAAAYGWSPTAEAMDAALTAWTAEVDLLTEACTLLSSTTGTDADLLEDTDRRTGDHFHT